MGIHTDHIGTLTIGAGTQESNVLQIPNMRMMKGIAFESDGTTYDGTVGVEVAWEDNALAAAHKPLVRNGTVVNISPTQYAYHEAGGFRSVMLDSSVNETPAVVVEVYGLFEIN